MVRETRWGYEESNPACKFTITQTINDLDVNYISNGTSFVYLTVTRNVSINCSLNLDLLDAFMPDLKVIKIHVTPLAVTLDLDADGNPFTIFEYSLNEDNEATITKYNGT